MTTTIKRILAIAALVIAANLAYSLHPSRAAALCTPGVCGGPLDCPGCVCWPNPLCSPGCCNE